MWCAYGTVRASSLSSVEQTGHEVWREDGRTTTPDSPFAAFCSEPAILPGPDGPTTDVGMVELTPPEVSVLEPAAAALSVASFAML